MGSLETTRSASCFWRNATGQILDWETPVVASFNNLSFGAQDMIRDPFMDSIGNPHFKVIHSGHLISGITMIINKPSDRCCGHRDWTNVGDAWNLRNGQVSLQNG